MSYKYLFLKSKGIDPNFLDEEELHSLYQQTLAIQAQIFTIQAKISTTKNSTDKNILIETLRQNKRSLRKLKHRFNYNLKHHPNFPVMRRNAKYYAYLQRNQDNNLPITTQMTNSFKQLVKRILNKDIRSANYFNIYANHLNYLHEASAKEILLMPFTSLADKQKEIFVDQLNRQPPQIKDKVLSSQSMNDLIDLRSECSRLKFDKLRYIVKEYQAQLVMNIKNVATSKHESIEDIAVKYLKKHNEVLATITGNYSNNLNSITIVQRDKKLYELYVEDKNKSNTLPCYLSSLDIMEFASAYLIEKQKSALKEILLTPDIPNQPSNDKNFPHNKMKTS